MNTVALTVGGAVQLLRSLNLSSQFKLGCTVLVAVLNVPSLSLGTLSNNKRFKCVRKLTGSLLRSARLSGALGLLATIFRN